MKADERVRLGLPHSTEKPLYSPHPMALARAILEHIEKTGTSFFYSYQV